MSEHLDIDPLDTGLEPAAMRRAHEALDDLYASGSYPALQVCVRHRGQIVLHRALGEYRPRDGGSPRPTTLDTRFLLFSVSKCIAAIALHVLLDRGDVSVDDPVYW